jgi:hypothetical protein
MTNPANDDDLKANPIETLEDAVSTDTPEPDPTAQQPQEEAAKPFNTAQLLGAVAMFSSVGLPPEVAESYRKDLETDITLAFLLEMIGLAEGLAAYGIGAAGGKMPDWLKVLLGTGVLGFFLYQKRGKYGAIAAAPVVGADGGGNTGFVGNSSFGFTEVGNVNPS